MEAAALEQTLREHPDDMAAWLVYGDWLSEQEDARGGLIQLEHRRAIARSAERPAIEQQIAALVEQHRPSWSAALPAGVTARAWRHGFVTEIGVVWSAEAPAQIARALEAPFVTALRIAAPDKGEDEEEEEEVDDDGMPLPAALVDVGAIAAIDLRRLTALDLSYVHLGAPGAAAVAASTTLGGLVALDLRYCGIGDAGLAAIAGAPLAKGVRRLHLQRCGITAAGAGALQGFGALAELDLRYNEIGAEGAGALLEAPFLGGLQRLWLHRADVSDAGARALARSERLPAALRSYWRSL